MADARDGIGGNNPPDPIDPLIVEALERIQAANRWITERPEITDKETADKAAFFAGQCSTTWSALDGQRLTEGRAFKAAQDAKYNDPLKLLAAAKDKVTVLYKAFLKKEEDKALAAKVAAEKEALLMQERAEAVAKIALEEAAKKGGDPLRAQLAADEAVKRAEEAAQRAADAPVKAQIKGTYTTTAKSLRDVWGAEIIDLSEAFKHYNKKGSLFKPILEAAIRECILGIAKKQAVALKDLALAPPGIRFTKDRV